MEDKSDGSSDLSMLILNHRTRQKLHRTIQVCSGLLVLLVVLVCVLTLVFHPRTSGQKRSGLRTVIDPLNLKDRPLSVNDIYISVKTTKKVREATKSFFLMDCH